MTAIIGSIIHYVILLIVYAFIILLAIKAGSAYRKKKDKENEVKEVKEINEK